MKKELKYFSIGKSYGGNQNWFIDLTMRLGGCAALTACDTCICLCSLLKKPTLYPFNVKKIIKKDYINFGKLMRPYLQPRSTGVDTLDIFIEGFSKYLHDVGEPNIYLTPIYGETPLSAVKNVLIEQIDDGIPVPFLTLNHKNPNFKDYDWHWYLIAGYDKFEDTLMVKAVTYGHYRWLSFNELWDTGYEKKGGFISINTTL